MVGFSSSKTLGVSALLAHSLASVAAAQNVVVDRDVAIIGGGGAGIYSAIQLRDAGKSVAVIEQKNVIGGHTVSYTNPATGKPVNVGVMALWNHTVVTDYFARLNTSMAALPAPTLNGTSFVDFTTGSNYTNFKLPTPPQTKAGFANYIKLMDQYPYIQGGFNLTYPVADDLLLPFGQFAAKYNLSDLVQTVWNSQRGYVPFLNVPTLYHMKHLNDLESNGMLHGFLTAASHNTHELYDNAATVLGSDVWLNSTVHDVNRSNTTGPVILNIDTPNGRTTLRVKKVINTIPPTMANWRNWDRSDAENALLPQFFGNGYYSVIVKDSGVGANQTLRAVGNSTAYGLPTIPGLYSAQNIAGTDLTQVLYGTFAPADPQDVRTDVISSLNRVLGAAASNATIVFFADHSPFNMGVSTSAIQDGFYQKLLALQGQRNTYYAGAAWQTQGSSPIWLQLNQTILPQIIAQV